MREKATGTEDQMAQTIDKLEQIHIGKKGAAPIAAPGWAGKPADRVKLVDCDWHCFGTD